ncbi:hypothetical protein Tco_0618359 [Tanacetum coccineum]
MDDEPMWAADRVVAMTPGSAITILETANEFAIKVIMEYLIASLVGPAGDPWDRRVRSQLIGKDLASRILVYELPLSSVGIKRLHDDLGVNTSKVRVTAAKHNLVLLVILVKNMLSS